MAAPAGAEHERLATSSEHDSGPWKRWGPYLAERAWGTVREDYSPDGHAWDFFPHDHARSRAYRWSEDGLAGISDIHQYQCVALALWNGNDAILKERIFGLSGPQGNHGEDAKEYWWFLDSTPSHSWMRWRYHYPHAAFPYDDLVEVNAGRTRNDPEYELLDTGVFDDDRYFVVTVDYAKATPDDICMRIEVTNAGPDPAPIHVLPTVWFRNRWSWSAPGDESHPKPTLRADDNRFVTSHGKLGDRVVTFGPGIGGEPPTLLVCDNETNGALIFGPEAPTSSYPKDAIGDSVVRGVAATNPSGVGTKGSAHYYAMVEPGATVEFRVRFAPPSDGDAPDLAAGFDEAMRLRRKEADEFYAELTPANATAEEAVVMRQACAGLLWSKQLYHYKVDEWLDGDQGLPPPPPERLGGRNHQWRHFDAYDILAMPDTWEYPWFAAWDLAFHSVAFAHIDPGFAKHQLLLLLREWYMHPNGQLPAYEWDFSDVNPPVHAWAALRVFRVDGGTDVHFLARVFHKLLVNFTWWVNRTDAEGNNLFEGGFLGLDNISVVDRSKPLVDGERLEQSDATSWMATYCLNMLEIALILADHDHAYEDIATKFFEHFAAIATAINAAAIWDEEDGFYYDILRSPSGESRRLPVRSVVGLIPLFAVTVLHPEVLARMPRFRERTEWFIANRPDTAAVVAHVGDGMPDTEPILLSLVSRDRLPRIIERLTDPDEFWSNHGIRSLSRFHHDHPVTVSVGGLEATVDYEPGESSTALFGGNSNWRGPVWMPINVLLVAALRTFGGVAPVGDDSLTGIAQAISDAVVGLFLPDPNGRRPVFGDYERMQTDVRWRDQLLFYEYFHGDTGAGLGASHQTGWTALVIDLLLTATG